MTVVRIIWVLGLIGVLGACGSGDPAEGTGGAGGQAGAGARGGGGGVGGTGGVQNEARVEGFVISAGLEGDTSLANASVSAIDTGNSTVSGPDGAFSLLARTGASTFVVRANEHWGQRLVEEVPAEGRSDLLLEAVSDDVVTAIGSALMQTIDTSKGIVVVSFGEQGVAAGGESADLGVDYGFSFVFDEIDEPLLGRTLVTGGGTEIIFVDVDVAEDVVPTASSSDAQPCVLRFPDMAFAAQAKLVTGIDVECP